MNLQAIEVVVRRLFSDAEFRAAAIADPATALAEYRLAAEECSVLSTRAGAAVWSAPYYREVAARADQLVVMAYDSALPWDRAYSLLVKQQTTNVLWAVRDTRAGAGRRAGLPGG